MKTGLPELNMRHGLIKIGQTASKTLSALLSYFKSNLSDYV